MLYKGVRYSTYEELRTIAEKRLSKGEKKNFNKAQIGKYIADMGYLKRRIQINGLRKLYYFNVVNKLNV
ncbi:MULTISPECIES: hypothetical protein [Bacteroidales]|jgi:hypothetical protein|uniref:hypothetical protein n=1 Tax=Bacteroidales TaxID=171549 RepID=UPI000E551318|nr:hypothetical protein DW121_01780 [Bacteroides sp. AM10-21B]